MADGTNESVNEKQENLNILRRPVSTSVNLPAIRPNAIDWTDMDWVVKKSVSGDDKERYLPKEEEILSSELALADRRGKFYKAKINLTRIMISNYCVNLNPLSHELLTSRPSLIDSTYKDEVDFFPNNPHIYFKAFKHELEGLHEDDIKEDIESSTHIIQNFSNVTENIAVPLQLHLGIMLNVYRERLKANRQQRRFVDLLFQTFGIKKQSAYNYMNAALVVDYVDDPEVYTLSLTALYALYKLYKRGTIKDISIKSIINLFINISSYAFNPNVDDFSLAANYVIYFDEYFKNFDQNKEYILDLYTTGFEWKKSDRDFILHRGKNDKQYLNDFMELLLENNMNRKIAKQLLLSKKQSTNPVGQTQINVNQAQSAQTQVNAVQSSTMQPQIHATPTAFVSSLKNIFTTSKSQAQPASTKLTIQQHQINTPANTVNPFQLTTQQLNKDEDKNISLMFILEHGEETLLAYRQGKRILSNIEKSKLKELADNIYSLLGLQK